MPNPFTDHPASVGETYFEHMATAWRFSRTMFVASFACFIHAFLPFLFVKTGSEAINRLYTAMVTHRTKTFDDGAASAFGSAQGTREQPASSGQLIVDR